MSWWLLRLMTKTTKMHHGRIKVEGFTVLLSWPFCSQRTPAGWNVLLSSVVSVQQRVSIRTHSAGGRLSHGSHTRRQLDAAVWRRERRHHIRSADKHAVRTSLADEGGVIFTTFFSVGLKQTSRSQVVVLKTIASYRHQFIHPGWAWLTFLHQTWSSQTVGYIVITK